MSEALRSVRDQRSSTIYEASQEQSLATRTPRLPRHRRAKPEERPGLRLTARHREVIRAVAGYRALDRRQIQTLLFPSKSTTNYSLRRLYQHGYLERKMIPVEYGDGMRPAVYTLGRKGAELVGAGGWTKKADKVAFLFLEHLLCTNGVRIAVKLSAHRHGWAVREWRDERELKGARIDYVQVPSERSGRRQNVPVIPDGYFILDLGGRRAHFFLEVDRGTMALRRFRTKVDAYLAYVRSGMYQRRYRTRSLRVLTVTTGETRMRNLRSVTERAGGNELCWFCTFGQATAQRILTEPIWLVAGTGEAKRSLVVRS